MFKMNKILLISFVVIGLHCLATQACDPYSKFNIECNVCLCSGDGKTYHCSNLNCENDVDLQFLNEPENRKLIPYGNDALPVDAISNYQPNRDLPEDSELSINTLSDESDDNLSDGIDRHYYRYGNSEDVIGSVEKLGNKEEYNQEDGEAKQENKKSFLYANVDDVFIREDPKTGKDIVFMPL